ncbi:expressed unknown protein [Seminavis robusta]|uniref:Uncharacterized protein n=1 Tax=Seminavis robusta TaxID=568900 RepID=A0A9N8EQF8_9STRA|nr:expressed unknown protein [Seminavis robusta]|eukprot:Sro1666_g289720.1 n/a (395) ;mRNA; f:16228-17412
MSGASSVSVSLSVSVDLSSLLEGQSFEDALVRLESRAFALDHNNGILQFWFRQEAPVKFLGKMDEVGLTENDKTRLGRFSTDSPEIAKRVLISGVLKGGRMISVNSLAFAHDQLHITASKERHDTGSKEKELQHCKAGSSNNEARKKVLQGGLLRFILENYIPIEDIQTSAMPVHPHWHNVGESLLLQKSYSKIPEIDLQEVLYQVFQGARHHINMAGDLFSEQEEYQQFLMAGVHLCDLTARRNNAKFMEQVYVRNDAIEPLELQNHQPERYPGTNVADNHFSDQHLHYMRAACIQLSKLTLLESEGDAVAVAANAGVAIHHIQELQNTHHRRHVRAIGYAMHNVPTCPSPGGHRKKWGAALRRDNLLCQEMMAAGEEYFGDMGWFWDPCEDD